jgi:hypothetical protein
MTETVVERTMICQECAETMESLAERCDYEHGCREPLVLCGDCGAGMVASENWVGRFHRACLPYKWNFYDTFSEHGFDSGESRRNYTHIVHDAIEAIGYMVDASKGGFGNTNYIERIIRISDGKGVYGGYRQCPDGCDDHACPYHQWLGGYMHGRTFANTLPQDICGALYELQATTKKIPGFMSISKSDFVSREHPLG